MKKRSFRIINLVLCISLTLVFCGCSIIPPKYSKNHVGAPNCVICRLNYFEETASIIKKRAIDADTVKDGEYYIEAVTDDITVNVKYDEETDKILSTVMYYEEGVLAALFMITLKRNTGTTYGWSLYHNEKIANGTFSAEELTDLEYRPPISHTEFSEEEFELLDYYYSTGLSFCVDMLYSVIANNPNHLTLANLGFKNYTPNVEA